MILKDLQSRRLGEKIIIYNYKGLKLDGRFKEINGDIVIVTNVWIDDDPSMEFEMSINIKDIICVASKDEYEEDTYVDDQLENFKEILLMDDIESQKTKKLNICHKLAYKILRAAIMAIIFFNKMIKWMFDEDRNLENKSKDSEIDGNERVFKK